jgi:hypothetical protein
MREFLTEAIRAFSGSFETIRVDADDNRTLFSSSDKDGTYFLRIQALTPVPELKGSYGITNLPLLKGLLDAPAYKAPGTLTAKHRTLPDGEDTVEQFEFREANGTGADFRLMSAKLVPTQPDIREPTWDVITTPDKAVRDQFASLAGLYAKVDGLFSTTTAGSNLVCNFGSADAATHRASMVYADDVSATLRDGLLWKTDVFLQALKTCGTEPTVKISNKAALLVEAKSEFTLYKYYLRTQVR